MQGRERRDKVRVTVSVTGKERCGTAAKQARFGAVVEALTNVVKHAGVGEANVDLNFGEEEAVLRVADHGIGFDIAAANSPVVDDHTVVREGLRNFLGGSPGRTATRRSPLSAGGPR
jgi:signal transduction histidine kinase